MAIRASNPAAAFLQGYAFVDQMESNKQDRKFQAEQQSWLRKAWARKDEAYEKGQLDTYRAEKAAEFSLITDEIMQEQGDEIERLKADGSAESLERVKQIRADWFDGDKESRVRLINEGWKRQLQRDPRVGELFGLVNGQDPAAGPLVRDPRAPVSGMVVAPPSSPFAGRLYMEIDSLSGPQAMTEGRGAGKYDKAWSTPATLSSLYAMYGSPELIKKYQIFGVMMADLGANEATGTTESVDTAKRQAATNAPAGDVVDDEGFEANQAAAAAAGDQVAPPEDNFVDIPALELEADMRDKTPDSVFARGAAEYEERTENDQPPVSMSAKERGRAGKGLVAGGAKGVGALIGNEVADTVDTLKDLGKGFKEGAFGQFLSGLTGIGDSATAETGPDKAGDIVDANKQDPSSTSLAESTANSATTQKVVDKTPAPANNQAAANIGNALLASQGQSRPPPEDVYKALMMARVGIFTLAEVDHYKRTGQLGQAAEVTLQNVGNGTIAVYDKAGNLLRADRFGDGDPNGIDVGERREIFNFIKDQTESEFLYKGEVDERAQGQFINALEEIYGLFGIDQNDGRRTNDKFLNAAARGARFVQRFDEDDIQGPLDGGNRWRNIDVTFGDMEVPFTAGNVALGTVFSETGITRQQDAAFAFKEYIKRLQPGAGFSDAELLDSVQKNEPAVREQWRKSLSTGSYTLPSGRVVDERHSLERVREEVVKDLIETHAKGL